MDISLEDLKVALGRAQANGFTSPDDLAAFAIGYLSAGPLTPEPVADTTHGAWHEGDKITDELYLGELPQGSEVTDDDGDYYVKYSEGWAWYKYANGYPRLYPSDYYDATTTLVDTFPATVVRVGA